KGFTLPEMILVVVVMGIFLTMAFPDITRLMRFSDQKSQEANMKDIQTAIEVRLKDSDRMRSDGYSISPQGSADWVGDIEQYAKLPSNLIENDEWGQALIYRRFVDTTQQYNGVSLGDVVYVAIVSTGANRVTDTVVPATLSAANYATLEAAGDDLLIKYTNYPERVKVIDDAIRKIRVIEQRLESYAESALGNYVVEKENHCSGGVLAGYSDDLLACYSGEFGGADNFQDENKLIFYPPDFRENTNAEQNLYGRRAGPAGARTDATFLINTELVSSITVEGGSPVYGGFTGNNTTANYIANTNAGNRNNRGVGMIRLMRIIGLPDENCCTLDGEPFYYYSLPDEDGNCGTITRPGINEVKKPAKVTIEQSC
ncbi:MAG: type II secretion system protein, partial [Alphaproteobacteria bacterium]|nr:type II secretion system protein [Alphaproteobacteria bacterium]